MVHLVYCDDKEKVLEKILAGTKTMVTRRNGSTVLKWTAPVSAAEKASLSG